MAKYAKFQTAVLTLTSKMEMLQENCSNFIKMHFDNKGPKKDKQLVINLYGLLGIN